MRQFERDAPSLCFALPPSFVRHPHKATRGSSPVSFSQGHTDRPLLVLSDYPPALHFGRPNDDSHHHHHPRRGAEGAVTLLSSPWRLSSP